VLDWVLDAVVLRQWHIIFQSEKRRISYLNQRITTPLYILNPYLYLFLGIYLK
jgi:hypothetical protein